MNRRKGRIKDRDFIGGVWLGEALIRLNKYSSLVYRGSVLPRVSLKKGFSINYRKSELAT
jgi:hypothetical protein